MLRNDEPPTADASVPQAASPSRSETPSADRRRTPRRRLRDRIASLDATDNPALRSQYDLRNLMLLVDDDLRQTALALGAVESYLARTAALLENPEVTGGELAEAADDEEVLDRIEDLSENLDNLRHRMGSIAASLK